MLDGELTRAQRMAAFVELCNQDTTKAVSQILIDKLPAGNHEVKLSSLPEFTQAVVMHFGGSEIFNANSVREILGRIPATQSGDEIAVVEAITRAHNFLSNDKI